MAADIYSMYYGFQKRHICATRSRINKINLLFRKNNETNQNSYTAMVAKTNKTARNDAANVSYGLG